jgi:TolA-binding protein
MTCPSDLELSRALNDDGDAVARHVAGCASCRATQDGWRRAIALAKALPTALPDEARLRDLRVSLHAHAAAEPVGAPRAVPWSVAFVALAAAVVVAVGLGWRRNAVDVVASRVDLRPSIGARYTIASPPPHEIIRLWDGQLDLDVQPLGPGERVVVTTSDSEVEVRGTRFQLTAREDRLVGVEVTHGRVEVRPKDPKDGTQLILGAGERWTRPPSAPPAVAPAPDPPAEKTPRPSRRLALRTESAVERVLRPTRQEALYDDAWDALRARRFDDAALGFERVLAESSAGPLGDEAAFWRATSFARGGEATKAMRAFREFLSQHGGSSRRGEASAILGWLFVDAHRAVEAAPLFRAASDDPRETVRASAKQGLAAVPKPAEAR